MHRADRKRAPESLGRVLVLGLGKSGRAVAQYALQAGDRVESLTVVAPDPTPDAERCASALEAAGAQVRFACECVEGSFDLCVVSPGIPQGSALYRSAAQASGEIIGEVEFAWRESEAASRWIAVTGTNGKTTVTALVAHVLRGAGVRAKAVGNIGDTCLEAVVSGDTDVYVAEVSSYQLASTTHFAPDVAVILTITPDHLHWHGSFESYRDAKLKILANRGAVPGGVAVLDATGEIVRDEVRRLHALSPDERGFSYVPLGTSEGVRGDMRAACGSENAAFLDSDDVLHVVVDGCDHAVMRAQDLQIKGQHNSANALAGAAAALALGVDAKRVAAGLRTFAPLEHRIEPCGSVCGIACYNDSKATNVDASRKALAAFPNRQLVVLLGGDDKGTDLDPLIADCHAHARAAVCFGAAADRFVEAFERAHTAALPAFGVARAQGLEEAFDTALSIAQAGGVILLSPACASFDEFKSFEERGVAFKNLVAARATTLGA